MCFPVHAVLHSGFLSSSTTKLWEELEGHCQVEAEKCTLECGSQVRRWTTLDSWEAIVDLSQWVYDLPFHVEVSINGGTLNVYHGKSY